jgi:flagellar FliJ protein
VSRFQENRKAGLSALDYQNYHNFIDRLDEAISGQQQVVKEAQERIDTAKASWQECERKRASYEILQTRAKMAAVKKENKREQRDADEFNSRKARMAKLKR